MARKPANTSTPAQAEPVEPDPVEVAEAEPSGEPAPELAIELATEQAAPAVNVPETVAEPEAVPTIGSLRAELEAENEALIAMRLDFKAASDAFRRAESEQYGKVRRLERAIRNLG